MTDDPETPGASRWEINLATIASHTIGRWDASLLDADINYGWGDHVQLKAEVPFTEVHDSHGGWKGGLGTSELGVKWRFIDRQEAGFAMSTYPQYSSGWSSYSRRRGIADNGHAFFLPVEAATEVRGFGLDAEAGRNFVTGGASEWVFGAIVAHACREGLECMLELRERISPHDQQVLINLGAHWRLSESLSLLVAAGREFGPATVDQYRMLAYVGLQVLR